VSIFRTARTFRFGRLRVEDADRQGAVCDWGPYSRIKINDRAQVDN